VFIRFFGSLSESICVSGASTCAAAWFASNETGVGEHAEMPTNRVDMEAELGCDLRCIEPILGALQEAKQLSPREISESPVPGAFHARFVVIDTNGHGKKATAASRPREASFHYCNGEKSRAVEGGR
jgi:hypothetical protein